MAQPTPKWSLLDLRVCRYAITQKVVLIDEARAEAGPTTAFDASSLRETRNVRCMWCFNPNHGEA